MVLSEIAKRALSPAVNDPGTAIDVVGRLLRILSQWCPGEGDAVDYPNVIAPALETRHLLDNAFLSILRDAGANFEVHLRIHQALAALVEKAPDVFGKEASALSRDALEFAADADLRVKDVNLLREVAVDVV